MAIWISFLTNEARFIISGVNDEKPRHSCRIEAVKRRALFLARETDEPGGCEWRDDGAQCEDLSMRERLAER